MIAELKITFQNRPDNLLQIVQTTFHNHNVTLQTIINNTIYHNSPLYHNCFVHGFQATDATLLFQVIGNDLLIHIEIPPTNNLFVSLRAKVNAYYRNLIGQLKNYNISIDKIEQEVMIMSEDSYIFVGKIPNKNKDFAKQLYKDKFRIIIVPTVLLLLNIFAKYLQLIDKIETAVAGFISVFIGLIIWYGLDYFLISKDDYFKFEPINE
jgi:hypothetical protein